MNTNLFRAVIHRFDFWEPIEFSIKGETISVYCKSGRKLRKLAEGRKNDVLLLMRIAGFSTAERRSMRILIEKCVQGIRNVKAFHRKSFGNFGVGVTVHKHGSPQCTKRAIYQLDNHNSACTGALKNITCKLQKRGEDYKCVDIQPLSM